jgi:hypothetical protein
VILNDVDGSGRRFGFQTICGEMEVPQSGVDRVAIPPIRPEKGEWMGQGSFCEELDTRLEVQG